MVEEGSLRDLQTDTEHGLFRSINCCFDRADTRIKVPRFLCYKTVSGSMIFLPIQATALLAVLVLLRGTPLFIVIKIVLSTLDGLTDISYLVSTPFANIPVFVLLFALYACATITPLVVLVRNAVRSNKGGWADLLSRPLRTAGWLLIGIVVCELRLGLAPSIRQWWVGFGFPEDKKTDARSIQLRTDTKKLERRKMMVDAVLLSVVEAFAESIPQLIGQTYNDYIVGLSIVALVSKVLSLGMILNGIVTYVKYTRGKKGMEDVAGMTSFATRLLTSIPCGIGAFIDRTYPSDAYDDKAILTDAYKAKQGDPDASSSASFGAPDDDGDVDLETQPTVPSDRLPSKTQVAPL
mmetsp:Transcript_66480/g.210452  ORF Transcript_66480/g.210452 Transcript_66480/m.210452 type:complete len:351 (+) Transcript_66480:932-1984(+)